MCVCVVDAICYMVSTCCPIFWLCLLWTSSTLCLVHIWDAQGVTVDSHLHFLYSSLEAVICHLVSANVLKIGKFFSRKPDY